MRTKRKSLSHIIDATANEIIRSKLPIYWSIRDYKPDYGIDLAIELFEKSNDGTNNYDTLGEHIFIQVKGTKKIKTISKNIMTEHKNAEIIGFNSTLYKKVSVIPYILDTNELFTIQRMGNVVPVLLFLVDIDKKEIYYLNINDYIDKVLYKEDPVYYNKATKVIHIPIENKLDCSNYYPIYYYAKRPKFYSLFLQISFQYHELQYVHNRDLLPKLKKYAEALLRFDIWSHYSIWGPIRTYKSYLQNILNDKAIGLYQINKKLNDKDEIYEINGDDTWLVTEKKAHEIMELRSLWNDLANLHNIYEEMHREYFLPTYLNYWMQEEI
jgi:hypothetical protein